MERTTFDTVDAYISSFPKEVQLLLEKVRATIRKELPKAEEKISYGIPVFLVNGKYVIYFAGFKNHISVYPAPRMHEDFKKELSAYKGGKGTVQFPINEPIPLGLITRITKFRLRENKERDTATPSRKTAGTKKAASKKASTGRKAVAKKR